MTDCIEDAKVEIARLTAERDAAIEAFTEAATMRGRAEGKLAASELPGIVDRWRDRAERAEAEAERTYEVLLTTAANLAATLSLLERAGKIAKKAAPSDKMCANMLVGHRAALERARVALAEADKLENSA